MTAAGEGGGLARLLAFAGVVLSWLALSASPLDAQVQDTLRADTLQADTLMAEQDTLPPPPVLVPWPRADTVPAGLADGRWVWDEEALLAEGAISVPDLLSRVPGIVTLRSGVFLQPETISVFGGGADRLVVIWDGFVLDPLITASLDLSTIHLSHLERLEVHRRADALVIRLHSDAPDDARAYSRIEAGVGEPDANLFRGMLLTPNFLFGPFGFAVERLELRGSGRPQPADVFAGWLRWGLLSETRGIEFTLRNGGLTRAVGSPVPADISRRDLVVRGRTRVGANAVAEAYFGRSTVGFEETDPEIADSLRVRRDLSVGQAGARLAWDTERLYAEGAFRWRDEERLPSLDFEINGQVRPLAGLQVDAGLVSQKWDSGFGATSWWAAADYSPRRWIRAFTSLSDGRRGSPSLADSITTPHKSSRSVFRGGLGASLGRLNAAVAGIRMSVDSVPLPGLPIDTLPGGAVGGATIAGWEASAAVPLIGDWLGFDGSYTSWFSGVRSVYTPASMGRATLRIHTVPLESGNFELIARMDALHRGPLLGPPAEDDGPFTEAPARTLLNSFLQIRILDVRIWVRFDDMLGTDVQDAPGLFILGPRIFYGVKWSFWN